uniref:Pyruvate phosphate dikinase AMP/ATP-binding domain-containing protein n=1 Tax=Acrobeloides nanus TaxID=290746 RepID=A0A914DZ71_9BILA
MVLEFLKLCTYYVIFWFYSILHKKRASYNLKDLTKTNNAGDWLAEKLDKNERYIIEGSAENGDHLYIELDTVNKEAFLILQVGESLFTLPGSYAHVLGFDEDNYLVLTAGPLRIELRDPFRRWRIVIRGILRADDGTDHFVRFHAWWFPTSDPNYFLQSLSPTQLAETACALDNLYFVKELENRNDFFQWGLVKAHILVDGSNEYFLDFRGVRIRTLPLDSNSICITDFFVSYMKHGNRILLYRVHCPETSYHIKGGSFFYSNLHQKSIEIFPNNFSEFTLNGKTYSLHQNEKSDFSFQLTKSITKLKYLDVSLSDDQDNGYGYMVSTKPVWNQEKGKKFKESIKVLNHKASPTEQKLKVLRLTHQACRDPTLAGGKGSNLAKLSGLQDTFSVPPGVVVTVSAYLEHLEANPKLKYLIEKVDTNEDLMEIEKLIKEEFLRSSMSPELKDEIIVQLQRIFGKDRLGGLHFAVRSSAVGEDGTELSSAGQLETFLQVPIKNISEKILECWASNFRHEIVRYRKENGQLLNVPVAVVIQEMIENGAISGVMFTNDPVKGDPSFLVINMIEGLGEELVSGQKTPTEMVMKKSLDFIKKPENMLISEEKCRELAKVGILLEEAFNAPQDIEFVVKDGEIFVVQSRNITNLDLETEWELEHEFDRAVATDDDVISTANVGEVLPYAISPLTCDFLLDLYDRTIHTLVYGENVSQAPQFQHYAPIFKVYQQRLFFNLIDSYMRNWETLSKDRIPEYALAGTKLFTDEMFEIGSRRYPKLSRMDHIRKLKFLAKVMFFESSNYLPMAKKYLDAMESIKISSCDSKAAISALMQQRDLMCQILFLHASASMYSSFTYVFVAMILRGSAEGDLTPEILSDIATIYSRNTYEIVSADVPKSMKKLAKAIYEEDLQEKFKSMENPQTAIDWLLSLGSKSGELARTFMETHGHRGLNELALLGVAWRDDPGHLVKNLRVRSS